MSVKNFDKSYLPADYQLHWYRLSEVIGRGGFGVTYRAEDMNLKQIVAIKEYYPREIVHRHQDLSVNPLTSEYEEIYYQGLNRFTEEARTLSNFDHPNLARVYSVFEANNTAYIVMKFEHGDSLKTVRNFRVFSEAELTKIISRLLDGVETLHAHNFIHRDIKPANILLRKNNSPVLIDFGSARSSHGQTSRNLTCFVSPGFAPIEQYITDTDESGQQKQGPWTDIYGLGASIYYAIMGVNPSDSINRSESLLMTGRDTYIPLKECAQDKYSNNILEAVDRGLAFKQHDRPQSINEWRKIFKLSMKEKSHFNDDFDESETIDVLNPRTRVDNPLNYVSNRKLLVYGFGITSVFLISILVFYFLFQHSGTSYLALSDKNAGNANYNEAFLDSIKIKELINKLKNSGQFYEGIPTNDQGNSPNNEDAIRLSNENFQTAVNLLKPRAESGSIQAQYDLGIIYFPRDIDESIKWYRLAAEQGHSGAQKQLGLIYSNGMGVNEDDSEGFKWYYKAAEQGDSEAQFMLGTMYSSGEGISQDKEEARKWFNLAGKTGYKNATETIQRITQ